MATTFGEIIRQVMLKLKKSDGLTRLSVEAAINDAQRIFAAIMDFDELMVTDESNATTANGTKRYHIESNLGLTRPKDIYSIRLMSNNESRKLVYKTAREFDNEAPYPEGTSSSKPTIYTQRGKYVELFPIPDANYALYIQHSQWPAALSNEATEIAFSNIDYAIIQLSAEMALASLEGSSGDWVKRAKELMAIGLNEERTRPDRTFVARPFNASGSNNIYGEYWKNPWIKRDQSSS